MHRPVAVLAALALLLPVTAGCRRAAAAHALQTPPIDQEQGVAPGVVYRWFGAGGPVATASDAAVLDADLRAPAVRVRIACDNVRPGGPLGRTFGDSYSVKEWCRRLDAAGGVNGGFFGQTDGLRKEVIGLLAAGGLVRSSGSLVRSPTHPDRRFARCVFGLDAKGVPRIGWAVGQRGRAAMLTDYPAPLNPRSSRYWTVNSAVACGPRLIACGAVRVTDREERLVSPPTVHRTFVAYDVENGAPRHLVLGIGLAMTFQDAAAFLQRYFQAYHRRPCWDAMCLDGGASTQLAYRVPTGWADAHSTLVTVPTAILVTER